MPNASLLRIGVSGLMANQASLRTVGHNIANTDTPGYSRQRTELVTQTPNFSGAGFQGAGVKIDLTRRIVDDFTVNQLRLDTSAFGELDSYLTNIKEIDSLLADVSTGLAPGIQQFFASLNTASDDPTSIPVRQLAISQAKGLVDRFETIQSRLEQQNEKLNQQLSAIASEVSSLANGIAGLNRNIVSASGRGQDASPPNDLLDTRDELLRKLSELVSVNVIDKGKNTVDVFVGNGQALVIGNRSNELRAVVGGTDPFRRDLAFINGGHQQIVTGSIQGGQLGGLLSFRGEILDKTLNNVGRLGLTIASEVNNQHVRGLDLDGIFGGLFFQDINTRESTLARVVADKNNASGNETRLSVTISDTSELSESDYILSFPGPGGQRYVLSRVDNGDIVQKGVLAGVLLDMIEADGFQIFVETGAAQAGDRFLIQPTRRGGHDIGMEINRPASVAIASAVAANSSLGNEGSATIISTEALDVSNASFAVPGQLSPPVIIRFTSETTYDVLDNTNPAKPVDLVPPLRNLTYVPGAQNKMLPDSPGQTAVTSDGLLAGRLPEDFVLTPDDGPATNGYVSEILTITTTDPVTGIVSIQPDVNVSSGESARVVARDLSGLTGVDASARTRLFLSEIVDDENGSVPMLLTINGVDVNSPASLNEPSLLTTNYLADIISANPAFEELGITARSDGDILVLESLLGDDINVAIRGDKGDSFTLTDVAGSELLMTGAGGSAPAAIEGNVDRSAGYNFNLGGPYSFTLSVNGGVSQTIALGGNQVLGSDVAAEIQQQIDASNNLSAGDVVVSIVNGRVSLTTRETGPDAIITIVDVTPAANFALGIVAGTAVGADLRHEATIGGVLEVVMEEGVTLASNAVATSGNLFRAEPDALSTYLGYQVTLNGIARNGDKFTIDYNGKGVSDNRNGLALTAIETTRLIDGSSVSLLDSYGRLVEFVGALTSMSLINAEASESLLQQSQLNRDSVAGVNLDEEAADLIRFELAYNASAQVISVARTLFETLINTFR